MKKKRLFIALLLCGIGLVALWVRSRRPFQTVSSVSSVSKKITPNGPRTPFIVSTPNVGKEQMMSQIVSVFADQPIEFYGKVVDQDGIPVEGADVKGNVMVEKSWMGGRFVASFTRTDKNGYFDFRKLRGAQIVITPSKSGYEFKPDLQRYFYYSLLHPENERYIPDPHVREAFVLFKLKGAEPMVHVEIARAGIGVDGVTSNFDLMRGRKSSSAGDVAITIKRDPIHIDRNRKFSWSAIVEVSTGGTIEMSDAYPYEAPEDGYKSRFVADMPSNAPNWSRMISKSFYFKAREGKIFGRMNIEIVADAEPPPVSVSIEAWINPAGSRNLEYDPRKEGGR